MCRGQTGTRQMELLTCPEHPACISHHLPRRLEKLTFDGDRSIPSPPTPCSWNTGRDDDLATVAGYITDIGELT